VDEDLVALARKALEGDATALIRVIRAVTRSDPGEKPIGPVVLPVMPDTILGNSKTLVVEGGRATIHVYVPMAHNNARAFILTALSMFLTSPDGLEMQPWTHARIGNSQVSIFWSSLNIRQELPLRMLWCRDQNRSPFMPGFVLGVPRRLPPTSCVVFEVVNELLDPPAAIVFQPVLHGAWVDH
jgi:hypothetical protein